MVVLELRGYVSSGYMPTHSFLNSVGRGDLSNQISRRGGWRKFASLIGVPMTPSDTVTGWAAEDWCIKDLASRGYMVERQATRTHFDLLIDGLIRVDVKGASFASYGRTSGWFYRMGKVITADVVVCVQMDCDDCYIYPWFSVPATNLTITPSGGMHSPYRSNYDLIELMLSTRRSERSELECMVNPHTQQLDPVRP